MVMSTRGVVSSGHYLATEAGMTVLRKRGNAMDAAAAVGFALTVLQPHQTGIAGEVPMVIYCADEGKVWAVSGQGVAPREATLERFSAYGLDVIPGDGFLPAVVPATVASWILLLQRFGTMGLADVLEPAVELAGNGFPVYDALHSSIGAGAERFRKEWPSSADVFMPGGEVPAVGSVWRQADWARTFNRLIAAESGAGSREEGLQAAHDEFYRGEIARRIVEFCRATSILDASGEPHTGLLTLEDLAGYKAKVEEPVETVYRGNRVYKCSSWTQGPVLLQVLNLLENFDLRTMGHNSSGYIHTVIECMKLALADREFYYGDPEFAHVPFERLLSAGYARERCRLVDEHAASMELRPGGKPALRAENISDVNAAFAKGSHGGIGEDTTKLEVIDGAGNMVSATTSGGWMSSSPVIPGLGFPLGTRGQMFSLVPGHPNCLEPGKRPRTTLTPSLLERDGKLRMAFGSPGGDCQDQWALQFLLNVLEFGMSLQEAVEAPTFWTAHIPSSFYPRAAEPGAVYLEGRIGKTAHAELAARGHVVHVVGDWVGGNTLAASIDLETGVRCAAASPRLEPASASAL